MYLASQNVSSAIVLTQKGSKERLFILAVILFQIVVLTFGNKVMLCIVN